jgi:hypothetical protein
MGEIGESELTGYLLPTSKEGITRTSPNGEGRSMNEAKVREFFVSIPGLEQAVREHCKKIGIEFRYGDVETIQPTVLRSSYLREAIPVTTDVERVSSFDPTLSTIARVFLVYSNGDSFLYTALEQKIERGQSLSDTVEPELIDGFISAVLIWTEMRRSLLGSSILGVRHWVEFIYRPNVTKFTWEE